METQEHPVEEYTRTCRECGHQEVSRGLFARLWKCQEAASGYTCSRCREVTRRKEEGVVAWGLCQGVKTLLPQALYGAATTESLAWEIKPGYDQRLWLYLNGGPTGFESCAVEALTAMVKEGVAWCACAGTSHNWPRLVVPQNELASILNMLREVQDVPAEPGNSDRVLPAASSADPEP